MPKLSVVIPTYTLDEGLEKMAIDCLKSYRYYADEIIVTEDGGKFSPQLLALADVYCYFHENKGFTVNVNRGWKIAKGDFVAIASSDTYLVEGDLKKLMVEGRVTSPEIVNQFIPALAGPFFVVPKEIAKERGYLMEEMKIYCSDSEYDHRVEDIFQKIPEVKIIHKMAQTVTPAGVEGHTQQEIDRAIYERLKQEGKAK
jgi:glycosyltransferase involved in cell wall biosynthesis